MVSFPSNTSTPSPTSRLTDHLTLSQEDIELLSLLAKGLLQLPELAEEKRKQLHPEGECVICGAKLPFHHYALEFGTHIRKRARFCGLDCLQEFLGELAEAKGLRQSHHEDTSRLSGDTPSI